MHRWILVAMTLAGFNGTSAQTSYSTSTYFSSDSCSGTPNRVEFKIGTDSTTDCESSQQGWMSVSSASTDDYKNALQVAFGGDAFLLLGLFERDCDQMVSSVAFRVSGDCQQLMSEQEQGVAIFVVSTLEGNNSITTRFFNDTSCMVPHRQPVQLNKAIQLQDTNVMQNNSACFDNNLKWEYVSFDGDSGSLTSSTNPAISGSGDEFSLTDISASHNGSSTTGIVVGFLTFVFISLGLLYYSRWSNLKQSSSLDLLLSTKSRSAFVELASPMSNPLITSFHLVTQNTTLVKEEAREPLGLWDDSVITAERICRRKVKLHHLLTGTAFGEIYLGSYHTTRVAVKILSPEARDDATHANSFLTNAKWAASMNHPRLVHFIGVAWDTPADLCVVLELMEGGDLRTLLKTYDMTQHQGGIGREKASIAMHVCHALAYFHSSSPPTIFGDLSSRNILLNHEHEAKLKNFRSSKDQRSNKMLPSVEMAYCAAPELMLGAKCTEKVDIFAFGILLAELDAHKPPSVQVDFSADVPETLVELGLACVSPDPSTRPSATEVLATVQGFLRVGLN